MRIAIRSRETDPRSVLVMVKADKHLSKCRPACERFLLQSVMSNEQRAKIWEKKLQSICTHEGCERMQDHSELCNSHYNLKWKKKPEIRERLRLRASVRMRTPRGRFALAKHGAKKRGLNWELSLTERFIGQPCYYCGDSLVNQTGSGLDRIDCSKGYFINNVLPSCGDCNRMRSDRYTVEETKIMINALLEYRRGIQRISLK